MGGAFTAVQLTSPPLQHHAAAQARVFSTAHLGELARAGIPRDKMAVAFGMLLEPLNEADGAFMKRQLPTPVRILYPFLIQRPWTKYASTLRTGT
jgi:hypothetical protein